MVKKSLTLNSLGAFFLALLCAGIFFYDLPWTERVERGAYDQIAGIAAKEHRPDPRIVLVEIDDKSIDRFGSWPWPRHRVAELIDLLKNKGVEAIGLNLPCLEREHNPGLAEVKTLWERFEAYAFSKKDTTMSAWIQENLAELQMRMDGDEHLIRSVREAGNAVFAVYTVLPPGEKERANNPESLIAGSSLTEQGLPSSLIP